MTRTTIKLLTVGAATVLTLAFIVVCWRLLQGVLFPQNQTPGAGIDDSLLRRTDTPKTASGFQPGNAETNAVASAVDLPQRLPKIFTAAAGDGGEEDEGDGDDDEDLTPVERAVKEWEDLAEKLQEAEFAADPRLPGKIKAAFDAVPPGEDREYAMRAMMNLISDGAVQALVPILMDASYGEDILDIIFDDILNRDDEIKYPILEEIAKNPEHPNFTDAAHILEVTAPDEGSVVVGEEE